MIASVVVYNSIDLLQYIRRLKRVPSILRAVAASVHFTPETHQNGGMYQLVEAVE